MASLFKLAEQCRSALGGKGSIQDYIALVIDAYSALIKKEWYENRADGVSEVDGAFLYSFPPATPELDSVSGQYFIVLPSSFLRLPHEMGVVFIGFPKGGGFVRVTAGSSSMYQGLKSFIMGSNQTYFIEGVRIYFPKMTNMTNGPIACKLAIAYDNVDVDEELDIPRSIISQVIQSVVQVYAPTPPNVQEKIR